MADLIFLEWERDKDGYGIAKAPNRFPGPTWNDPPGPGEYLMPGGRASERYRPLEDFPGLFIEFAALEPSPRGAVEFCSKYGHPESYKFWDDIPMGRRVEWLCFKIEHMRNAVDLWKSGDLSGLTGPLDVHEPQASIKFCVIPGEKLPSLIIQPNTLLDGMWLQFMQAASEHRKFQKCAACPTWFAYGKGTKRRNTAIYCSDRCRKFAHDKSRRAKR